MKFIVISDVHAEQHPDWSQLVFDRCSVHKDADFVAILGDWTTGGPVKDPWDKYVPKLISNIRVPILGCIGNHDMEGKALPSVWENYWHLPTDYYRVFNNYRAVFWDSINWKHDDSKAEWLEMALTGPEKNKFLFTHFTPKIGHWDYGLGEKRTKILVELCHKFDVTACFTGHMHGFDVLKVNSTYFFICGGGGGDKHDNFPIMHRSNFYLLVETEPFHVTLCQQHRNGEQRRVMEEWINESRRPAF